MISQGERGCGGGGGLTFLGSDLRGEGSSGQFSVDWAEKRDRKALATCASPALEGRRYGDA